jgi:hypothetical protein
MKDIFKKIVRPLDLREYALEMEAGIQVWVNPPRALLLEDAGLALAVGTLRKELAELARQAAEADAAGGDDSEQRESVRAQGKELGSRINELGGAQANILSQLWSQGEDPETHWSLEEVLDLATRSADTDPALYLWLRSRTFAMISEYRAGQKKV